MVASISIAASLRPVGALRIWNKVPSFSVSVEETPGRNPGTDGAFFYIAQNNASICIPPFRRESQGEFRNQHIQRPSGLLRAGGSGFIIGDDRLNYETEKILETYYKLAMTTSLFLTLDYLHVEAPAYNRDRGPVNIGGVPFPGGVLRRRSSVQFSTPAQRILEVCKAGRSLLPRNRRGLL